MNAAKMIFSAKKIQTKQAAKDLDIEVTRLAKILNGSIKPNVDEAEGIRQYLDLSIRPVHLFTDIPVQEIERFLYEYFARHPIT